jgi:shikimate dehydrogenase
MQIGNDTQLFGVFGNPVAHSLSPVMHNRAFAFTGHNGVYLPFCVEHIEPAVAAVRTLGIRGVSITLPHKVGVMACLDRLDSLAARIGAVNTIVNADGILTGYNTDCYAAVSALKQHMDVNGKAVAVIGAGGAARAIGWGVKDAGANVVVVNRSVENGERLAADLSSSFMPLEMVEKLAADVLINTTPVGMHPQIDAMPVPGDIFHKGMVVMDIVYTPLDTAFLKQARAAGSEIVDGLNMFVLQGARQFKLWTGLEAPVDAMREAVIEQLKLA